MKRTKMVNEDDKEAAVLIEKLWKWYRLYLISVIIFLVPFIIFPYGDFDNFFLLALLPYILIIIVGGGVWGLIWYRFLRCPFCHKYVLWVSHRSPKVADQVCWLKVILLPFSPRNALIVLEDCELRRRKGSQRSIRTRGIQLRKPYFSRI